MTDREFNVRTITLGKRDVGEKDVLVTFLTLERGKIQALVRGTKKPVSSLRPALDTLSLGEALIVRRRGASGILTEWLPVCSFPVIKRDPAKLSAAGYFAKAVSELTAMEVPEPRMFNLLENLFFFLQRNTTFGIIKLIFELCMLEISGQSFEMDICAGCGNPVKESCKLSMADGGIYCSGCSGEMRIEEFSVLSLEALRLGKKIADGFVALTGEIDGGGGSTDTLDRIIMGIQSQARTPHGADASNSLSEAVEKFYRWHVPGGERIRSWAVTI